MLKAFSFFFNLWDGFSDVLLNTVHSNSWFVRNHVDKACGRLKKKYSCCNFTVKSKLNTGRGIDRTRIRNGVNKIGRIHDSLSRIRRALPVYSSNTRHSESGG